MALSLSLLLLHFYFYFETTWNTYRTVRKYGIFPIYLLKYSYHKKTLHAARKLYNV